MSNPVAKQVLAGDDFWKLELAAGILKLSAGYNQIDGVKSQLAVEVDAGVFIDKLKELIPGKIDDALFDVLKLALKSIP